MPGWWCNNHLEKYESQWEGWQPIYEMEMYEMENRKCLKPPIFWYLNHHFSMLIIMFHGSILHSCTGTMIFTKYIVADVQVEPPMAPNWPFRYRLTSQQVTPWNDRPVKITVTLWLWLTVCHGKWPIEIDGLQFLKMVDLSSSLCNK